MQKVIRKSVPKPVYYVVYAMGGSECMKTRPTQAQRHYYTPLLAIQLRHLVSCPKKNLIFRTIVSKLVSKSVPTMQGLIHVTRKYFLSEIL